MVAPQNSGSSSAAFSIGDRLRLKKRPKKRPWHGCQGAKRPFLGNSLKFESPASKIEALALGSQSQGCQTTVSWQSMASCAGGALRQSLQVFDHPDELSQ
jgi:hypothetical protein